MQEVIALTNHRSGSSSPSSHTVTGPEAGAKSAISTEELGITSPPLWLATSGPLELPVDEVHVWRAALDLATAHLNALHETLSPEERDRAARFRSSKARTRFIAARGILRDILARYLSQEPAHLRLCRGLYGKPALATDCRTNGFCFHLSQSGDLALFALARREVGISLERFDVDLSPTRGETTSLLRCDELPFSVLTLKLAHQHMAKVVAMGQDWRVRLWQWQGRCPKLQIVRCTLDCIEGTASDGNRSWA